MASKQQRKRPNQSIQLLLYLNFIVTVGVAFLVALTFGMQPLGALLTGLAVAIVAVYALTR